MKTHVGEIGWRMYQNDRLVVRWVNDKTKERHWQGKRVGANCALPRTGRRIYVKQGTVATVNWLRQRYQMSLSEALAFLNKARY